MNDRTIPHEADVRAVIQDEVGDLPEGGPPVFDGAAEALFTLISEEYVEIPDIDTAETYINALITQYNAILLRLEEVGILTTAS